MLRKLSLITLLLAGFGLFAPAAAQSPARLERATISIWPEYDRPDALVILRAELPTDTGFPTKVELQIPSSVGQPFAVAQRAADDRLVNADYDFREGSEVWSTVVVTAETPVIWVEYYDSLVFDEEVRSFEYVWPGTPLVGELLYEVQHPVGASDLVLDPPAAEEVVGADGLVYSRGSLLPDAEGGPPSISLRYTKGSSLLTADALEASGEAAPDLPDQPVAGRAPPDWLAYAVGGLGVVLVAGALFLFRKNRASEGVKRSRIRGRRGAPEAPREGGRYCHQCGEKVAADDRFCSNCGAAQRRTQ